MVADPRVGRRLDAGSVALSPYAADLFRALTTPLPAEDPILRQPVDASRLSNRELGTLLPFAFRIPGQHPASLVRWGVEGAARERQPAFSPESCVDLLEALVANLEAGTGGHPMLAVNALVRCDGPWPKRARGAAGGLIRALLAKGRDEHPHALLALAGLAGGLTRGLVTRLVQRRLGPLARDELKVLQSAGVLAQLLVAEVCDERAYHSPPQLPDAWQRLAAVPEYASFARQALQTADARVVDIQAGRQRYVADRAFARDEVDTLGRAARVALLRDEPWLPDLLGSLVPGVSVAPTAASTLPSQALLFELARATADFPTSEALAALRAARGVLRHRGAVKQLDRMLKRIERKMGERPGVTLRLPDLGFGPDGVRTASVDGYQAMVTLGDDVELSWRRPDGGTLATVPAAVRRDHADELKALRDLVKRARGHRTTLARALENGYTLESSHPYARWRDELASNGVAWSVARRLIWEVHAADGWQAAIPGNAGDFHDVTGAAFEVPGPDAQIRLWHPLRAPVDEIPGWRDRLTDLRLRQPFKQAFREIYLLTPAETQTGTYSNRFAAHIVRYRQLYAVVKGRGWTTDFLGPWDAAATTEAYGVYAGGSWRAVFRHDYLEPEPDGLECAGTDRVWFERLRDGAWRTEPLAEVPAMVFSEAMRDVDLFIAVSSIAGDPSWADRGDDHHLDYWRRASVGELSASAHVRRAALERLIPRTRIADRCTLTDRHLVVRGDLHTYKIHLGSANILMEPDDRYLCIVPSPHKGPAQVFLPFEEDRLTLILSKAFMLADDATITDPSILAQLRRT
jgi:hypothetical protein